MLNDRVFPTKTVISQSINKEDEQHSSVRSVSARKNNRKNTKARLTQYVTRLVDGVFPPQIRNKCIKHLDHLRPPLGRLHVARKEAKNHTKFTIKGIYYITKNGKRFLNKTGVTEWN